MSNPSIAELVRDTEREFRAAFGKVVTTTSCETFGESNYRGGFRLILDDQSVEIDVLYSDMQLEVRVRGTEIFGNTVHAGFEGNMFSREHLREYLPRIAASVAAAVQSRYAEGQQAAGVRALRAPDSQKPATIARGSAAALG